MKLKAVHALLIGSNLTDRAQKKNHTKAIPDKTLFKGETKWDVFAWCLLQTAKFKPTQCKSPYGLVTLQNQILRSREREVLHDLRWSVWAQLRLNLSLTLCVAGATPLPQRHRRTRTAWQQPSKLSLRAQLCEESLHLSHQWCLTALS